MKKYLLSFLFSLIAFSSLLHAQKQQPQWEMPFYIEDANGDKDTVWVGYDLKASPYAIYDSIFESWVPYNDSTFNAILFHGEPAPKGMGRKKEITSYSFLWLDIHFFKGKLPLTIHWPDDSLYSENLPFPEVPGHPRAKMYVLNNLGNAFSLVSCNYHGVYVLTGDPTYQLRNNYECIMIGDSLWLSSPDNNKYTAEHSFGKVRFDVVPYNDTLDVGIRNVASESLSIYPNPFSDNFTIKNPFPGILKIFIRNSLSNLIVSSELMPYEKLPLDFTKHSPGIYYIEWQIDGVFGIQKIIKVKN